MSSFGGEGGITEFREHWHLADGNTASWDTLEFILTHGGAFKGDAFEGPYVSSSFPATIPSDDRYMYGAVLEDKVPLYSLPDVNSPPVAILSYHITKSLEADNLAPEWIKVVTTDGIEGFMLRSLWRNVIAYRARFIRKGGMWRMDLLVEGD
jgi:hypothetical protein